MRCPLCADASLEPTFVRGVEVDICPTCRGIWLDRGEIDRLVDDPPRPDPRALPDGGRPLPTDDQVDDRGDDRGDRRRRKKTSRSKRLADLLEDVLDL